MIAIDSSEQSKLAFLAKPISCNLIDPASLRIYLAEGFNDN